MHMLNFSWQIRSHAQKYFLKVQKNGTVAHVPPPRPKRKAAHPYPQKAPKNGLSSIWWRKDDIVPTVIVVMASWLCCFSWLFLAVLVPLQASVAYPSASMDSLAPGYPTWDDTSVLENYPSIAAIPSEKEYNLLGAEGMYKISCMLFFCN